MIFKIFQNYKEVFVKLPQLIFAQVSQIDGNYALAVLLTVVTNIAGIFTTPLLLKWVLTTGTNIELDVSSLLLSLSLSLLLPILVSVSALLQAVSSLRGFNNKKNNINNKIIIIILVILGWKVASIC